jgi:hypothetical protein
MLVELLDLALVPLVSLQCETVMDEPLVSTPVVMLTSTTAMAFTDLDVVNNYAPLTPPAETPPIIPPVEHIALLSPTEAPPMEVLVETLQSIDHSQRSQSPSGSMIDVATFDCPPSPTMPSEFPFDPKADKYYESILADLLDIPSMMDSVMRVFGTPRVCGLVGDSRSTVRVTLLPTLLQISSTVDGGAHICLTRNLSLLVDAMNIPPLPILVAVEGDGMSMADCCTKRSLLLLTLEDGSVYYQTCYYCANAVETIISPQAIHDGGDLFVKLTQTGYKDDSLGLLCVHSKSGLASMTMVLNKWEGLYYMHTDVLTVDKNPVCHLSHTVQGLATPHPKGTWWSDHKFRPVLKAAHTESELWMVWLRSPAEDQMDMLPGNVMGILSTFQFHPFRFVDFKEQACIHEQVAQWSAEHTTDVCKQFYMDYGFMRASQSDYRQPNAKTNCVVWSWGGYSLYLLVVDEASQFMWLFLTKSTVLPIPDKIEDYLSIQCRRAQVNAFEIANEFKVNQSSMDMIYMSPDPYHDAFNEVIDLRCFKLEKHSTAGLAFLEKNGCIILAHISPSTPCAKIPRWFTWMCGAWLIKIGDHHITSIDDTQKAFKAITSAGVMSAQLLFAHPEVRLDISRCGLPIVSSEPFSLLTHAQLNDLWEFPTVAKHLHKDPTYEIVDSGEVLNIVTQVMRLKYGKLLKQPDWNEWQDLEFLQLDQYDAQGMFGTPVLVDSEAAVFHSVLTYAIKAVDGRKKARWACDGSPRLGQAKILDETYANCVDQASLQLFYAIAAVVNLLIFGADVSNAFAEAPPPKQGLYIYPDRAFHE